MADWLEIPDSAIDPDAPLTSELAYAWRDNLPAVAEGADGAPRIDPKARKPVAGWVGATGLNTAVITGLDGLRFIPFLVRANGVITSGNAAQVSFSADSGATWGPWYGFSQGSESLTNTKQLMVYDRVTGHVGSVIESGTDSTAVSQTIGANMNAMRTRVSTSAGETSISILDFGGTAS